MKIFRKEEKNPVFFVSLALTIIFIILASIFNSELQQIATSSLDIALDYFGWLYLLSGFFFIVFLFVLMASPAGKIRLGKDSDRPKFSTLTWFAMLFTGGMAIGLIFWGVAEPVTHYLSPPNGKGGTELSVDVAMRYSMFHWGLDPWAMYAIVGLSMAYFQFRKDSPALISSAFKPLIGEKTRGPIGHTINIVCVFATLFGVATTFGLGAQQIGGGLEYVFGIQNTTTIQTTVILIITCIFVLSAVTGIDKGIKYLSRFNMTLALILLMFVFSMGPTLQILKFFISGLGGYIDNFVPMSLASRPFGEDSWVAEWTVFYWAWWISWAPATGIFIARISRGRTIREFILGVLIAPALFGAIWFSTFGGTTLHFVRDLGNNALANIVTENLDASLFALLENLPFTMLTSILGITLIATFFVTNADSVAFVLGMLSTNGHLNPSNKIKLIWGFSMGIVTILLLLAGGLETLQTVAIIASFPLVIIMVLMCFSLLKELRKEALVHQSRDIKHKESIDLNSESLKQKGS